MEESEGVAAVLEGDGLFLIRWYGFIIFWVLNKVLAGWLGCLAVSPGLMGLMEFECWDLISQLWWLGDRAWWIARAEGSPDSHARLMNCEMRQTYKKLWAAQTWTEPPPPPPNTHSSLVNWYALCDDDTRIHLPPWLVAEVMQAALQGAMETHGQASRPLQVSKSF